LLYFLQVLQDNAVYQQLASPVLFLATDKPKIRDNSINFTDSYVQVSIAAAQLTAEKWPESSPGQKDQPFLSFCGRLITKEDEAPVVRNDASFCLTLKVVRIDEFLAICFRRSGVCADLFI
jgi:hypothetical protein